MGECSKIKIAAIGGLACLCFFVHCSDERAVSPRVVNEHRLYAVGARPAFPIYYFAVDDTSHRLVDSVMDIGRVWQMECSPDGRALVIGRRGASGSNEIVKLDVTSKTIDWAVPGVALFALSATGDTIIASASESTLLLISATTGELLSEQDVYLAQPVACQSRTWVVGRGAPVSEAIVPVVVHDYEGDSIIVRGICRGLDGSAYRVSRATIDPVGQRLYATCSAGPGIRVVIVDIASWTTVAEFSLNASYGMVSFGPSGYPVFLPDPGTVDFTWGLIHVASPEDFALLGTMTTVGPPCQPLKRFLGKLSLSPDGMRVYAVNGGGTPTGDSPILVFDVQTLETIDWIAMPNSCSGGFYAVAVGPTPD